jgi:hypothetical protein
MSPPTDTTALVRRIEQLEARLDAAESVQQICDLKARYGAVTDRRYTGDGVAPADELEAIAHEVAGMFTRDGIWDGGEQLGRCEGRDAIYQRFLQPTLHFAWHFFVKPRIEVRGNEAEGTWDVFAPCTGTDGRPYWMTGVEHDRYQRIDGRWLHSYMKLDMVFMAPYDRSWSRRWAQQQRSPRSPQSG